MDESVPDEQLGATLLDGSEPVHDYLCDECWEDGKDTDANGYCVDCQEYLCHDCLAVHRRTRLTRRHGLLDKSNMPRDKPQTLGEDSQDACVDICPDHRTEIVKYYCEEHDTFGCTVCVTVKHRTCEGVGYIPQLCDDLVSSGEYQALVNELGRMERTFRDVLEGTAAHIRKAELFSSMALDAVAQVKEETQKVMEMLEANIGEQVEQIKIEDVTKMKTVESKAKDHVIVVEGMMSKLKTLQGTKQLCHLFAAMKEGKRKLQSLQSGLSEVEKMNHIREYEFVPKREFLDCLKTSIGTVTMTDHVNKGADIVSETAGVREIESPVEDTPENNDAHCKSERSKTEDIATGPAEDINSMTQTVIVVETCITSNEAGTPEIEDANQVKTKTPASQSKEFVNAANLEDSVSTETEDKPEDIEEAQKQLSCDKQSLFLLPRKDDTQTAKSPTDITAVHVSDINVKSDSDTSLTCYISGCILLPFDQLLLTDFNGSMIKMFDSKLGFLKHVLKIDSAPWEIARVTDDEVVISLPYSRNIMFLKVTDILTTVEEFSVNGNCRGVACYKDKLIVSYSTPSKIELLDMKGTLIKTLVNESRASRLFNLPYHVTVRQDDVIIYVSDSDGGNVVSLTLDGDVNAECKDLKYPRGMHVDRHGFVYVCARDFHYLYVITPECRYVKTVLTSADGLHYPMSACCDERNRKLYVGMNSDVMKVFQLSWKK